MAFWTTLFGRKKQTDPPAPQVGISSTPDSPQPFGCKTGWLAIRSDDMQQVASALDAFEVMPANWQSGLWGPHPAAQNGAWVFITPPVQGWILVKTDLLLAADHEEGIARMAALLNALSTLFGEAQYFGSYRVVDYVAWMRSEQGQLGRCFAHVGGGDGTLMNSGAVTPVERALGYDLFDGVEASGVDDIYFDAIEQDEELGLMSEDHPMEVAAVWSVNPSAFAAQSFDHSTGLLARIPLP